MGKKQKNFHAVRSKDFSSFVPIIFNNPYTDNDYDILEDIWMNTVVGDVIDVKTDFVHGNGVKPIVELKHPKRFKTDEDRQNATDKFAEQIDELIEYDEKGTIDFNPKLKDTIRNREVFGRSVMAFEPDGIRLPLAIKPIHPRDLGRTYVHQLDWSLSSVHAFNRRDLISSEDMVYLVNMANSPLRRAMWYGFSAIQRVVGQARALRKIQEFDIPEMATAMWASFGIVTVDNEGLTTGEKQTDLSTIKNNTKAGALNFINAKKDEINFIKMDTEPKVAEMIQVIDRFEREIVGNSKVPGPLVGREEESNMATLYGKIRLFLKGPIKTTRDDIKRMIERQYYERTVRFLAPEITDDVRIRAQFEPIIVESWIDNIDALLKLRKLVPSLPDEEILRLADLEELIGKLNPDNPLDEKSLKSINEQLDHDESEDKIKKILELVQNKQR